MTKYFAQGRDLSKPLVEVPLQAPWYKRLGLRLYGGYLWAIFGFTAFAALLTFIVWLLGAVLG